MLPRGLSALPGPAHAITARPLGAPWCASPGHGDTPLTPSLHIPPRLPAAMGPWGIHSFLCSLVQAAKPSKARNAAGAAGALLWHFVGWGRGRGEQVSWKGAADTALGSRAHQSVLALLGCSSLSSPLRDRAGSEHSQPWGQTPSPALPSLGSATPRLLG